MEPYWLWVSAVTFLACYIFAIKIVRNLNDWYYDFQLRNKKEYPLPPGDMGWPFIGKLLTFFRDFSSEPDSFINNFLLKYGNTGIYKTHLFGSPTIIVCSAETCKQVLTDDVNIQLGYPKSTVKLIGSKNLYNSNRHKHFKRLMASPMTGNIVLATYLERIENIVTHYLDELSSMKHPVEFLKETKLISFKILIEIFMGPINLASAKKIGDLFNIMSIGLFVFPIKAPGFAFNEALKARRELCKLVDSIIEERRAMLKNGQMGERKEFLDILLEEKDEKGQKLKNQDIIDMLIVLLLAGQETAAIGMMWSIIYLTQHPEYMKKAKEEQEEIMKARPSSQKHLSMKEIKQMVFLSKVINEMLRIVTISFSTFREAKTDLNINGYLVPKGWKIIVWLRALHMNPEYHSNPNEFNPLRWNDSYVNAGTFLPFAAGIYHCPGSDLAKLEITIYLHHFLLNYKLERINLDSSIIFLPNPRPLDYCLAKVTKLSDEDLK